uniref:PH domain-containing protein n=1 Tax=Hippocampus comes TaxID=109280 RepID=A0A3Q2YSM8_HIPCM
TVQTHAHWLLRGFLFKQWKKRFLLLTAEGSLLVCHHASAPPDQLVLLQSSCEAIVEGREILDLPKLPAGGSRDCCFALILTHDKYLLLLTDTPADCRSDIKNDFGKLHRAFTRMLSLV